MQAHPYRYTARDRECLERAMFFEANRSSREGLVAVGTVVMNRLKSGKHGDTICQVVGERGQFAPGVMTRRMNSRALPDVQAAARSVLKGERHPKLRNSMFFHAAGLKFGYKNMHYVAVAGGNAFYEKRGRNWQPLPPDSQFKVVAADQAARPETAGKPRQSQPVAVASVLAPAPTTAGKSSRIKPPLPNAARFGDRVDAQLTTASTARSESQTAMSFEATPENTDAIGALILADNRPR